jgi:hypothetical protein
MNVAGDAGRGFFDEFDCQHSEVRTACGSGRLIIDYGKPWRSKCLWT